MNHAKKDIDPANTEQEILQQVKTLQRNIEDRLHRMPDRDIQERSPEAETIQVAKDPFDKALNSVFEAEHATTVRSVLPKIFNRLLRKQNIVNRKLIEAIRQMATGSVQVEERIVKTKNAGEAKYADLEDRMNAHSAKMEAKLQQLQARLITQEDNITRLHRIIGTLQQRLNALAIPPTNSDADKASPPPPLIDFSQFYASFIARFRGPENQIRQRLEQHLPSANNAKEQTKGDGLFKAMDLGCGRGEWLGILRKAQLEAVGVDSNHEVLEHCREQGFQVQEGDAFSALGETQSESLSLLTAFHLLEHMEFGDQLRFMYEAHRVLKPKGVLITETPNIFNLDVGATGFYLDPTHIRPLPWPLAQFMAEYAGFTEAKVQLLNPDPKAEDTTGAAEWQERLHGPRDFALVAHK